MKNTTKTIIIGSISTLILIVITLFIMYKFDANQRNFQILNDDKVNSENNNTDDLEINTNNQVLNDNENQNNKVTLYLFHGSTCPACLNATKKMQEELVNYAYLEIKTFEVWHNDDNSKLMLKVAEKLGVEAKYIPFIIIGSYSTTGYNKENIISKITEYNINTYQDIVATVIKENSDLNPVYEVLK